MDVGEAKSVGSVMTNQVDGTSQIFVENAEGREMKHPSLFFYDGVIKSGTQNENLKPIPVTILSFDNTKTAAELYDRLAKFDHPGIIEAFSCGIGQGNHSGHSFLAVTKFETTFEGYFRRECLWATDQQKRFTPEFIKLLRDLIVAIEELHKQDYYCLKLDGSHIAVVNEGNAQRVKLWRFAKIKAGITDLDKNLAKNNDWGRLGRKIRNVSLTKEGEDLVMRMLNGDLKGRDILRHYALLTVREKFENILSLNQHISLNLKRTQKKGELLVVSNLCVQTLKEDLDKRHKWKSPWFIEAQSKGIENTLRGFINHLRTIIEHEVRYLTPESVTGVEAELKDLEHYFQEWEVYLKLQWIAVVLCLKY